jgi:hypothetical protein
VVIESARNIATPVEKSNQLLKFLPPEKALDILQIVWFIMPPKVPGESGAHP